MRLENQPAISLKPLVGTSRFLAADMIEFCWRSLSLLRLLVHTSGEVAPSAIRWVSRGAELADQSEHIRHTIFNPSVSSYLV